MSNLFDKNLAAIASGDVGQVRNDQGGDARDSRARFLDFLGESEGADYNTIVGGGKFNDFSRHPSVVGLTTKEGPSTAAGRYQILKSTYDGVANRLGIKDFSPESQDKIALELIRQAGALDDVDRGDYVAAISKLGKVWASLPSSTYSQPKRSWDWAQKKLGDMTYQDVMDARQQAEKARRESLFNYNKMPGVDPSWTLGGKSTDSPTMTGMDAAKMVASGAVDSLGSMAQAAGELGAAAMNKLTGTEDYEGKNVLSPVSKYIADSMTAGGKAAKAESAMSGDILDPSTWKGPETTQGLIAAGLNGFGSIASFILPMSWLGRGLKVAQEAGDLAKVAQITRRMEVGGAAVGGAMTAGDAANDARQNTRKLLEGMSHDQRMAQVPAYREAFEKYGSEETAIRATENSAAQWAGVMSGVAGAAGGALEGKFLGDTLAKTGVPARLGRAGSSALGAVGEGFQEGSEKVGQNIGENIGQGKPALQDATRDTFGDVVGGALVGGPMGFAGGVHAHQSHASTPDTDTPPVLTPEQQALNQRQQQIDSAKQAVNSPLTRAGAQADQQALDADLVAHQQAQSEFGQRVQAVEAMLTRDLLLNWRSHPHVGDLHVRNMLSELSIARNPNASDAVRDLAMGKVEKFLQRASVITASRWAEQIDSPDAHAKARDAQASYEQAFQDLVKADQLGASDAELMHKQMLEQEAQGRLHDANTRLAEIQKAIEHNRHRETEIKRLGVMDRVLSGPDAGVLTEKALADEYENALKREGFNDQALTPSEIERIGRFVAKREGFSGFDQFETIPSSPNEFDPYKKPPAPPPEKLETRPIPAPSTEGVVTSKAYQALVEQVTSKQRAIDSGHVKNAAAERFHQQIQALQAEMDGMKARSSEQPIEVATNLAESPPVGSGNQAAHQPAPVTSVDSASLADEYTKLSEQLSRFHRSIEKGAVKGSAVHRVRRRMERIESRMAEIKDAQASDELKSYVDGEAHQAQTSPENDLPSPSAAQIEAENYKKGHLSLHGMPIAIENPKGSTRSGVSPDGKVWETTMAAHYGYIKGSEGADGDAVDVFIGDNPANDKAYVIDQIDPKTGKFDEHKAVLGVNSEREARALYLANYEKGWGGLGAITEMPVSQFKEWSKTEATKEPVTYKEQPLSLYEGATDTPLEIAEKSSAETEATFAHEMASMPPENSSQALVLPEGASAKPHIHTQNGKDGYAIKMPSFGERFKEALSGAKKVGGTYWKGAFWLPNGVAQQWVDSVLPLLSTPNPTEELSTNPPAEALSDKDSSPQPTEVISKEAIEHLESKQQKTARQLKAAAQALLNRANAEIHRDRLTNTAKRANQAGYAIENAQKQKQIAETMMNIADAMADGKAGPLTGLTTKAQVETLDACLQRGMRESDKALSYAEQQKQKGREPEPQDIQNITMPKVYLHGNIADDIAKKLTGKKGYARAAAWASKIASRVGRQSVATLSGDDIEMARTVLKGLDAVGESKTGLGWQLREAIPRLDRLERMGITDDHQLHLALAEYVRLRAGQQAEDPVKAIERKLVGNKNLGFDFFPTPKPLAERMARLAGVKEGDTVLEPSAGNGNLADAARAAGAKVDVLEISSALREVLQAKKHDVLGHDFESHDFADKQYDAVIMNPPFSDRKDAAHIMQAWGLVKPGGSLVAIAGEGVFFGSDKKAQAFRDWLDERGADIEKLPEGTFNDKSLLATTGANARLVVMHKPEQELGAQDQADQPLLSRPKEAGEHEFVPSPDGSIDFGEITEDQAKAMRRQAGKIRLEKGDESFGERHIEMRHMDEIRGAGFNSVAEFVYDIAKHIDQIWKPETTAQLVAVHQIKNDRVMFVELVPARENGEDFYTVRSAFPARKGYVENKGWGLLWEDRAQSSADTGKPALFALQAPENTGEPSTIPSGQSNVDSISQENMLANQSQTDDRSLTSAPEQNPPDGGFVASEGGEKLASHLRSAAATTYTDFATSPLDDGYMNPKESTFYPYGMNVKAVQVAIGNILKTWKNAPETEVFPDMQAADARYRELTGRSLIDQVGFNVDGLSIRNPATGKRMAWLIAENIKSFPQARRILMHEAAAHYGLPEMLGQSKYGDLRKMILAASKVNPAVKELLADVRETHGDITGSELADELLARAMEVCLDERGEFKVGFSWLKSAWSKIAEFLRGLGFTLKLSNAEIQGVMVRAIRHLEGGGKPNSGKSTASTFRSGDGTVLQSRIRQSQEAAADWLSAPAGERSILNSVRTKLADALLWFGSGKGFNWLHRSVGTQYHKAQQNLHFKKVFDLGQKFLDDIALLAQRAEEKAPHILPRLAGNIKEWMGKSGLSESDNALIGKALSEGTLLGGGDPLQGKVWSDDELRESFGMDERQIGLYREAREAINESLDGMAKAEIQQMLRLALGNYPHDLLATRASLDDVLNHALNELGRAETDGVIQSAAGYQDDIQKLYDRVSGLKAAGYAPIMRFGDIAVTMKGADGVTEWRNHFDSMSEARAAAKALREANPDAQVDIFEKPKDTHKLFAGLSPSTLEVFGEMSSMAKDQIFQDYLRMAVSSRSAMSRLIHRQGTAGYPHDVTRTLASFITSNARKASSTVNMAEMEKAAAKIPDTEGNVKTEAEKLVEYLRDPVEELAKVRGFMFMNFLGGSLAAGVVNLTQPVMMTLPYLGQWGNAKAAKALTSSVKTAVSATLSDKNPNTGDLDLDAALRRACEEGITEPHEIQQLMATATSGAGSMAGHKFMRLLGMNFALTETFNRVVTFSAAYKVAKGLSSDELTKAGALDAYDFAVKAVYETQGLYNKGNRPNWARGNGLLGAAGTVIFTFKQYAISYVEFLIRLAKQDGAAKGQVAVALAMLVLAAGINGLPGADDLDDLIETTGNWLGYGVNAKKWKRKVLADVVGDDTADFLLHGASTAMPVSLQARLGLQNLIPGTGLFNPAKQDKGREVSEVFGVAAGVGQQVINSLNHLFSGNVADAALDLSPKFVRDIAKGTEMAVTGEYRDQQGRLMQRVDMTDAAIKAIGFQPEELASDGRKRSELRTSAEIVRSVKENLASSIANAIREGNPSKVKEAWADVREWNAKNPEFRVAITGQQVKERVKKMQMDGMQRFVKSMPKEIRSNVAEAVR